MPVTAFTVELTPAEDTFTPHLEEIEARLIDTVPLYDALWSAFRKIEQRRFSQEGPGWAQLAPSTVQGREAMGIGGEHPILDRSGVTYEHEVGGTLKRSLTTKGSKYSYMEPMPDGLFIGTRHPLAIYHQEGTHGAGRSRTVSMPARPLVDLTEADAEVFASVVSEYVYGFTAAVGGGTFVAEDVTGSPGIAGV